MANWDHEDLKSKDSMPLLKKKKIMVREVSPIETYVEDDKFSWGVIKGTNLFAKFVLRNDAQQYVENFGGGLRVVEIIG